jgi:hypothetical protein
MPRRARKSKKRDRGQRYVNPDFLPLLGRIRGREWLKSTLDALDRGEQIDLEDARILYLVFGFEPKDGKPLWESDYERDEAFNYYAGFIVSDWIEAWFAYWHLDHEMPADEARKRHWEHLAA